MKPRLFDWEHVVGAETSTLVRIADGTLTTWFPSIGVLLHRDRGRSITSCTGTVIGCDSFLTAAHCVVDDPDENHYKVFLQHGGLFNVRSLDWPKRSYVSPNEKSGSRADIAVLRLATPVEGIAPSRINDESEQALGASSQIVGFGRTAAQNFNTGLKRFGNVTSSSCPDAFAKSDLLCWRYTPREGSNTCYGDSGGPLLLSENRTYEVVAGVTSGGIDSTCATLDRAFDASVFQNREWIKAESEISTEPAQCGSLAPLAEGDEHRYHGFTGQINAQVPQHVFRISLQNVTRLRVGANLAPPIGTSDQDFLKKPELYIIQGQSRNLSEAICKHTPNDQAVFCELKAPATGVYTIILRRGDVAGTADFQLVVSVY